MSSNVYHEIKKMLCTELDEMADRGRIKGREDLEIIDLLTHSIKSVETIIAMEDAGYSGRSGHYLSGKRDSMGRYSRDSEHEAMMNDLHSLMRSAKDEHTRMKFQRFIDDLERE